MRMGLKMIKNIILMAVFFLMLTTGCSSITTNDDADLLKVDAGNDKTVYVGDTVDFEGYSAVKAGMFQREASWDFGDGLGEDGIQATHIYSQPGDYTAELTVSIIFGVTIWASDNINVKVNPLPAENFLPTDYQQSEDSSGQAIMNQTVTLLPDGRMALAGTVDTEDPSEIVVAVETLPGSRLLELVTRFMQYETGSLPDHVKAQDNENIEISAGAVLYNVCLNNGFVSATPIANCQRFSFLNIPSQ
jgi:hypothetical protein